MNGLGLPVKIVLTAGQEADVTQAETRLAEVPFELVMADKGFDSHKVVAAIEAQGDQAVIPSLSNRKVQRDYDKVLYKERNLASRARVEGIDCPEPCYGSGLALASSRLVVQRHHRYGSPGFGLAMLRLARGVTSEQQAEVLRISLSALALLSMCKMPRPDQREADQAAVTEHVGITVEVLEQVLGRRFGTAAIRVILLVIRRKATGAA